MSVIHINIRRCDLSNYTDADIEELKRLVPIWKAANTRIRKVTRSGQGWIGLCPFHDDTNPSFNLFTGEDGISLYKCQACGATGNVFQLIQKTDSVDFNAAVQKVADLAGWERGKKLVEETFKTPLQEKKEYTTFPLEKLKQAEDALCNSSAALDWLQQRGIGVSTAANFHLGYIQSASAVTQNHPWVNDGWIIFPTIENDVIVTLKYRSIKGKKTPDGKPAILRKSGMRTGLFNADSITPFDDVFVVEGEPDCMIMAQAGYTSVSLPGASFSPTPEMKDKLHQAAIIYLAGDMDVVGRQAMHKLWAELRDNTYLIEWPDGCKDANDVFLKHCGGDIPKFQELVEQLKKKARSNPVPSFYDLALTVENADFTNPMDDPKRLHFRQPSVDSMACVRPGSLVSSFATKTGTGKTSFWMDCGLHEAIEYGSVVLNYSGELSPQELAELTTAMLTNQDRLLLQKEDYKRAAKILGEARFYIGYNPDISKIKDILGDGTDKCPGVLEWAIRRFGANIVILDHLHFFTSGEREATQVEAESMTRMKNLARKYNLIFIVVGQSRKAKQGNGGKVSEDSDAKGSEPLANGTKILTLSGWKNIEDIVVGEWVIGSDGKSTKVTKVLPQGVLPSYRITFSDNAKIECAETHLWAVRSPNRKKRKQSYEIKSVSEIRSSPLSWKKYLGYSRWKNHIPVVGPIVFPHNIIPLDAYLMGALLGDGTLREPYPQFTNIDGEIVENVRLTLPGGVSLKQQSDAKSYHITGNMKPKAENSLKKILQKLGVWGCTASTKFIPNLYKFNTSEIRLGVLQGLLDTDGHAPGKGKIRYTTTSKQLADDVVFLVRSLGGLVVYGVHPPPEHGNFPTYLLCIWLPENIKPFRLGRKADRYKRRKTRNRSITDIQFSGHKEMTCISVEAPDGLFVAENFVVTHNSFSSTANVTYHIHRNMKKDIDWNNPPKDLLESETDIRLYKCRTKGPGNSICRLTFLGKYARFEEMTRQEAPLV